MQVRNSDRDKHPFYYCLTDRECKYRLLTWHTGTNPTKLLQDLCVLGNHFGSMPVTQETLDSLVVEAVVDSERVHDIIQRWGKLLIHHTVHVGGYKLGMDWDRILISKERS